LNLELLSLYKGEIRDSTIRGLFEKVRKRDYGRYLLSVRLEKLRLFKGVQINFDFPVTALVGPNGGGKSTILGAIASGYISMNPSSFFPKSFVGDSNMIDWLIEYEAVDKQVNPQGTIKTVSQFREKEWFRDTFLRRNVKYFSINRTIPATESPLFMRSRLFGTKKKVAIESITDVDEFDCIKEEAEKILGKSLSNFRLVEVSFNKTRTITKKILDSHIIDNEGNQKPVYKRQYEGEVVVKLPQVQRLHIGGNGEYEYSEFNFGSGEASILRMISDIESLPNNSLVLLEELENGLHPVAVRRMVEYFIDVARRKTLQIIFTTHSDFALEPLPSEAIWASWEGKVQQGKLSIEALRAISGRVDKRLAIFVEDVFAKTWLETVLREKIDDLIDEVGIYAVAGDGNAVKTHTGHMLNPAISFHSLCLIDGDSKQKEDASKGIYRLPGSSPESTIFDSVLSNLNSNIALLTIACQRSISKQDEVAEKIKQVSHTNRDPHLLFNQIGLKIGFVSEPIVRGAFLSVWIQENQSEVEKIVKPILEALDLPPKRSA